MSHLCTASFQFFTLFCNFSLIFPEFYKKSRISQRIKHFSPQISQNFAGIAGNCGELPEHREFCSEFLKFFNKICGNVTEIEPMARADGFESSARAGFEPAFCEPWRLSFSQRPLPKGRWRTPPMLSQAGPARAALRRPQRGTLGRG